RKLGLKVEQQKSLTVRDEDGTILGEYFADLLVEDQLIVEVKAAKAIADEHLAQVLGYLRSARMEHGVLVNFGAAKFQIRKLAMSEVRTSLRRNSRKRQGQPQEANDDERGQPARTLISFVFFRFFRLNPIWFAAKNEKRRKEGLTFAAKNEKRRKEFDVR